MHLLLNKSIFIREEQAKCRLLLSQTSTSIINKFIPLCSIDNVGYEEALSMMAVPRLHQLDLIDCEDKRVRIIQTAASKWKRLATRLHFEPSDIDRIRSDHPGQCYYACWQVCREWLEGVGRQPTSWTTLINALDEAELGEIATDLETIISRGIS